ncbi:hypothetical protein C4573_01815 [Candidatus Woesearchaeota archaeon]|nr:MAG: hypothetical protein C4573_01815 [Candidatus Woesearchaeota archaeon]
MALDDLPVVLLADGETHAPTLLDLGKDEIHYSASYVLLRNMTKQDTDRRDWLIAHPNCPDYKTLFDVFIKIAGMYDETAWAYTGGKGHIEFARLNGHTVINVVEHNDENTTFERNIRMMLNEYIASQSLGATKIDIF